MWSSSSDEEEWVPSEEEEEEDSGSSSSGGGEGDSSRDDDSSKEGSGQATRGRKRKAMAKAQAGKYEPSSYRGEVRHDGSNHPNPL